MANLKSQICPSGSLRVVSLSNHNLRFRARFDRPEQLTAEGQRGFDLKGTRG